MSDSCQKCGEPATVQYTWPGRPPGKLCEGHATLARTTARGLGFDLKLTPIAEAKPETKADAAKPEGKTELGNGAPLPSGGALCRGCGGAVEVKAVKASFTDEDVAVVEHAKPVCDVFKGAMAQFNTHSRAVRMGLLEEAGQQDLFAAKVGAP